MGRKWYSQTYLTVFLEYVIHASHKSKIQIDRKKLAYLSKIPVSYFETMFEMK